MIRIDLSKNKELHICDPKCITIDAEGLLDILDIVSEDVLEKTIYALPEEQAERIRELLDRYHKCGTQQQRTIQ